MITTVATLPSPDLSRAPYTERNWRIVDTLRSVAGELGRSMAQVAIHWATHQRGMTSTIIGATKLEQLDDNLRALDFTIQSALWQRLDEVSRPDLVHPCMFFTPAMRAMMSGGVDIIATS